MSNATISGGRAARIHMSHDKANADRLIGRALL